MLRLKPVRAGTTLWCGVALGWVAWSVMLVLALVQGIEDHFFSLATIGVHVRFLVAVPLFFLCEMWVRPRMDEFLSGLVRCGIVTVAERPRLIAISRLVDRLKDPWLVEVGLLLAVLVFTFMEPAFLLLGRTGSWKLMLTQTGGRSGLILSWYLWFCLPLFRVLLLRWVWHLGLWCYLLWRLQRFDLDLVPTHPDHAAGLGYLEIVQEHFCPLAVAISAVLAASFAEGLAAGTMRFEALYVYVPLILLVVAVLFLGPLFIFSAKLWNVRVKGWSDYMVLASRYVGGFDRKWLREESTTREPLVGTPDLQSLADLTNSLDVVRNLRVAPISQRLVIAFAAAVAVPMLPLVLFKYPAGAVAARLFQSLTGL